MDKRLLQVRRTFIISIVGLVTATLAALTGTLLLANIIGYDDRVSGNAIHDLTSGYPEVTAYLESQKDAEPHFETIATLVKQEQERRVGEIILIAAIPLVVASGIIGYVLARRLLQPVAESYEAQERFIQDAAHELRNPLAAMSATLEATKIKSSASSKKQLMDRLERQTKRLISINEDLLFLQRAPEALTNKLTDVSEQTRKIIAELKPYSEDMKIKVTKSISDGCKVAIMPRDYEIVVRNLLENAIKYSKPNSTVSVDLTRTTKEVILEIQDHGIGIPSEELAEITKRFYRATNTGEYSGTGLGLALVQKVVSVYKAELDIKSTESKGTTVRVTFQTK